MGDQSMTTDPTIAALLREREGYVRAGKADRVAQVDEQLVLHGYEPRKPEGEPRGRAPKGRQSAAKSAT